MSIEDYRIDWQAVAADSGAAEARVGRVQRVVAFFDRLNLGSPEAPVDPFRWRHLEVFERLAAGSFGTVYRAYDGHLRREVALKLLPADAPGASGWLHEARRLARVRHANVVAILGAEVDGDYAGIWMELSDGRSLESALEGGTTLPESAVPELIRALASALAAIHARDLVHGDLKAGNLLVEPSGRVLVLDFGAAAEASAQGPARAASPLSAAPEVLAGEPLSPAADLYALGVLLYRCLCGAYPFGGNDVDALHRAQQAPPELSCVPREYRGLVASLLARDPGDRPDADGVLARLADIEASPARRRRRLAAGVVIGSLAVGVVVAALGWWQTGTARDAARRSAQEARAALQFFQDVVGASFQGTHGKDARVVDVLEQAQRQLALDDTWPPYVRAMVHYVVGSSYLGLGRTEEGMALLDHSLAQLANDDGEEPEAVSLVLVQQGLAWCDSDAEKAEAAAADIRRIAADRLRADHRVFAAALKIEACAAQRRGDDALAEEKLRAAMDLRPVARFPADQAAIGTVGRLGSVLLDQRRVAEALPLLEQARSRYLALLGPRHDATLSTASALAGALIEASRYREAVALLDETLPEVEARSGPQSPQWIVTTNTLAIALARAGEPGRALDLTEAVIDTATARLGAEHRFTLSARTSRAVRLKELGRLDEAEAAMAEAASVVETAVGVDHPLALMNHVNRIEALLLAGRGAAAVELGRSTLARCEAALGPEHGITAGAQAYLARALAARGEVAEAERLFGKALAFQDRDNPESVHAFETRYHLAAMLADQGRVRDARAELAALQPARERLPGDHPLLADLAVLEQRLR